MESRHCQKIVKHILEFKAKTRRLCPKLANKLVGDLGELYAIILLHRRGFNPIWKSGHSACDINLTTGQRIEVRTSLLKNEGIYGAGIDFFGWRVEGKNQKRKNKFDFLVCIALDNSFKKPKFYIFSYKEAFSVGDVIIPRFRSVKKKINLFENKQAFRKAVKSKPAQVTTYERFINRHPEKFLNRWGKIGA